MRCGAPVGTEDTGERERERPSPDGSEAARPPVGRLEAPETPASLTCTRVRPGGTRVAPPFWTIRRAERMNQSMQSIYGVRKPEGSDQGAVPYKSPERTGHGFHCQASTLNLSHQISIERSMLLEKAHHNHAILNI